MHTTINVLNFRCNLTVCLKAVAAKQLEARKRKDRADLFTDNWGGDVWKGSKVNVLSIILAVSVLVPLGGLLFAYLTFGTLWG